MEINKDSIAAWLQTLQDSICTALEGADGTGKFSEDKWTRNEGGGGRSRVITNGSVIEKGGVMFSAVGGKAPDFLFKENAHSDVVKDANKNELTFFATGVSIVIHPNNPFVPIIHMNIRYFEMSNGTKWLGGGIDLTPHYIIEADAKFFHGELKQMCDKHHTTYYPKFKTWADDYFYIPHRNETRGIGGIFFDRLHSDENMSFEQNFLYWQSVGTSFAPIYLELIARNKSKTYSPQNRQWQMLRRGRYVEFNLVYDKGTRFGLETNGRVESILMSLPNVAGWEYDFKTTEGSPEGETLQNLKKGMNYA